MDLKSTTSATSQEEDTVEASIIYNKSFTDFEEAQCKLEELEREVEGDDVIFEAGVNYINTRWRVHFSSGPKQGELFD